ncbi:MAG TPA: SAM-dependent methyltransferase [Candidatus Omnitrophota bacterium]|nr:SAM-dependent methyltransferase [Candidatus Omnitrophota bacterium]
MAQRLFLIPNTLSEEAAPSTIPGYIPETIKGLRVFLVEEGKSARRFLKKILPELPLQECEFLPLNEHTTDKELAQYIREAKTDLGVISEAGVPCVADPGSALVLLAHQNNWQVIPLIGPSSILLALMSSGLNGQSFAFNGYLPQDKDLRKKRIKELERLSAQQTQIFMETPYRNDDVLQDILAVCDEKTRLCVAAELTGPTELIKTQPIARWRKEKIILNKRPALFLLQKRT